MATPPPRAAPSHSETAPPAPARRSVLSGGRVYQVGGLEDPPGWDHIGNDPGNLHPVEGTVEIDVNEIDNTVNPAAIQIDFFIRSPEGDARNNPTRKVFAHFFAMEVTWR